MAGTASDKTVWLKENLKALDKTPKLKKLTPKAAVLPQGANSAQPKDELNDLVSARYTCQLRPFLPNRKLPSQKELDQALVAQTPRLAPVLSSSLSGSVSAFDHIDEAKTIFSYARPITNSKTINVHKATSSSVHPAKSQSNIASKAILDPVDYQSTSTNSAAVKIDAGPAENVGNQPTLPPPVGFHLMRLAEQHLFTPTETSPADQAIIDQYAQSELGENNSASVGLSSQGDAYAATDRAGPAPFPLNLLPQASLKQLMRGMVHPGPKCNGPQPYFGCWHRTRQANGLMPAGFQSHIHGYSLPSYARPRSPWYSHPSYASHAPTLRLARSYSYPSQTIASLPFKRSNLISRTLLAPYRIPNIVNKVAVYPPYTSYPVRLY